MRHDELEGSGVYRHDTVDTVVDAIGGPDIKIQHGYEVITSVANTPVSAAVTYSTPFTSNPIILVTPVSGFPETCDVSVSGGTTTGCTLWLTRTSVINTTVYWMAVGT